MTTTSPSPRETLQLGEPVAHRGVVVAPLFPRHTPKAVYTTLDQAAPKGLRVTEVDDAGSVGELLVENPTDVAVLLYDGEELLGAKQNRVLNVSVLVAPHSVIPIPVSCVEHGRWSSQGPVFHEAPAAGYPELRRHKAEALSAEPMRRGRAQGEVWKNIADKAARMQHRSSTGAHADMHRDFGSQVANLARAFPAQPGQCGAVLALDGRVVCLDAVSRPDAFALLYPKLLRGYMLDAMETLDRAVTPAADIAQFVHCIDPASARRSPSAGLGDDLRMDGENVIASGLELDGELIQLSAYGRRPEERGPDAARIARPGRRRQAG